jgi:hypothetical membrane protein
MIEMTVMMMMMMMRRRRRRRRRACVIIIVIIIFIMIILMRQLSLSRSPAGEEETGAAFAEFKRLRRAVHAWATWTQGEQG